MLFEGDPQRDVGKERALVDSFERVDKEVFPFVPGPSTWADARDGPTEALASTCFMLPFRRLTSRTDEMAPMYSAPNPPACTSALLTSSSGVGRPHRLSTGVPLSGAAFRFDANLLQLLLCREKIE